MSVENFSGGGGQKEHQDREIAPISLTSFCQWQVRGRTGQWACTQGIPQRNAAPRAPRKSEDLFMEKYHFPENCLSFYKISA